MAASSSPLMNTTFGTLADSLQAIPCEFPYIVPTCKDPMATVMQTNFEIWRLVFILCGFFGIDFICWHLLLRVWRRGTSLQKTCFFFLLICSITFVTRGSVYLAYDWGVPLIFSQLSWAIGSASLYSVCFAIAIAWGSVLQKYEKSSSWTPLAIKSVGILLALSIWFVLIFTAVIVSRSPVMKGDNSYYLGMQSIVLAGLGAVSCAYLLYTGLVLNNRLLKFVNHKKDATMMGIHAATSSSHQKSIESEYNLNKSSSEAMEILMKQRSQGQPQDSPYSPFSSSRSFFSRLKQRICLGGRRCCAPLALVCYPVYTRWICLPKIIKTLILLITILVVTTVFQVRTGISGLQGNELDAWQRYNLCKLGYFPFNNSALTFESPSAVTSPTNSSLNATAALSPDSSSSTMILSDQPCVDGVFDNNFFLGIWHMLVWLLALCAFWKVPEETEDDEDNQVDATDSPSLAEDERDSDF